MVMQNSHQKFPNSFLMEKKTKKSEKIMALTLRGKAPIYIQELNAGFGICLDLHVNNVIEKD